MNRKETTQFLTDLLIKDRLSDRKYYAKEVTLDYGTSHPKRIDVMEFRPGGTTFAGDIEKGIFVCYEVKSCYEDVYSGNGLNFYGEKNYIVTTMETYKKLRIDEISGKLENHIKEFMGERVCPYFGFMTPVPADIDLRDMDALSKEWEEPTDIESRLTWKYWTVAQTRENHRKRSMNELLFCMLRAKHNYTNIMDGIDGETN